MATPLPLDTSISDGDSGHEDDHETIHDIVNRAVTKDGTQTITGDKTFTGAVAFDTGSIDVDAISALVGSALNPKDPQFAGGAKGDIRAVAVTTTASSVVVVASGFTADDIGKRIYINEGGAAGGGVTPNYAADLLTTIIGVAGTNVTLDDAPGVSGAKLAYVGTDDTAALDAWADAVSELGLIAGFGGFHGYCPPGQYWVEDETMLGDAIARRNGSAVHFAGRDLVQFWWFGPQCDDGSTPGTYPKAGESVLNFQNLWLPIITGGFTVKTPWIGNWNRVGVRFDATINAGMPLFEGIHVSGMVTAVHLGAPITYTGGTWLEPTGWTAGSGQYNGGTIKQLFAASCIEAIRQVGANGEHWSIDRCETTSVVCLYKGFNGRGMHIGSGDMNHGGTGLPFPGQTPNDYIDFDVRGSGVSGGGAFSAGRLRVEQAAVVAKSNGSQSGGVAGIAGTVPLLIDEYTAGSVPLPDVTQAGSISAGSNVLAMSLTAFGFSITGRTLTIPGAGPAGADLVTTAGIVKTLGGSGEVYLEDEASTTVSGASVVIDGLDSPLDVVTWRAGGTVRIAGGVLLAPLSRFTCDQCNFALVFELRGVTINNATADADITTLVRSTNVASASLANGVELILAGCKPSTSGSPSSGFLADRKIKLFNNAPTAPVVIEKERRVTTTGVDYTVLRTDDLIHVTANTRTMTLPSPQKGDRYTIKMAFAVGSVVVQAASGTIDGAATNTISTAWQARTYYSDGTNWFTA